MSVGFRFVPKHLRLLPLKALVQNQIYTENFAISFHPSSNSYLKPFVPSVLLSVYLSGFNMTLLLKEILLYVHRINQTKNTARCAA